MRARVAVPAAGILLALLLLASLAQSATLPPAGPPAWDGATAGSPFVDAYGEGLYIDEGGFIDLDGDGIDELLVPGDDPRQLWAYRDGRAVWNITALGEWSIYNPHSGLLAQVADLDGDGLNELIVPNRDGFLRVLDPIDGSEWWAIDLVQVPLFSPLLVDDLDPDADGLEILAYHEPTAGEAFLSLYGATGDLLWRLDWQSHGVTGQNDYPMSVADVDGDGALDLFASAQNPHRIDAATGAIEWRQDACGTEAAIGPDRRGHLHACTTPAGALLVSHADNGDGRWQIDDLGMNPVALLVADLDDDRSADIVAVDADCRVMLVDGAGRNVAWSLELDLQGCQQVPRVLQQDGAVRLAIGHVVIDPLQGRIHADLLSHLEADAPERRPTGRLDTMQADGDAAVELFMTSHAGGYWTGRDADYVAPTPWLGDCDDDCPDRERPKVGNTSQELRDNPPPAEDQCIDNCDVGEGDAGGPDGSGGGGGGNGGSGSGSGAGDDGNSGGSDAQQDAPPRRVGRDTSGQVVTCPPELTLSECDAIFGDGWNAEPVDPPTVLDRTVATVKAHPIFFGGFVLVSAFAIYQWRTRYY